ncbi:zonular occludens toxin domain-containing protein [Vibrio parahaemolyticus]|uniref:zonular occludens toxin domain-containing protein n=1 Tax=Vibrio parahaemolyticus TaxID=670 RepID=UPI0031FED6E6
MIYGFSGGIGTGKTLNAIKELIENELFIGREIFYHGVRCLLLDYSVCKSFHGWFYGIYWPANNHNKSLERKVLKIDTEGRLADIEDFPYLAYEFSKHDPVQQWLYWYKKNASKKRMQLFEEALDVLNIDESQLEERHIEQLGLSWKQLDNPLEVHKCPSGSVIFIDEVQNIWPPRNSAKQPTEELEWMTKSRHNGTDLLFVTQDFKDVDQLIRRRVQQHLHLEFLGGDWLRFYRHVSLMDNASQLNEAETSKHPRDKSFYGVYLSGIKHTQKPKMDPQLKKGLTMLAFCFVGLIGIGTAVWYFVNNSLVQAGVPDEFKSEKSQSISETKTANQKLPQLAPTQEQNYITRLLPDEPSLPFSAPAYSGLTAEANQYPELTCVITKNDCSCFTQQLTQYAMQPQHCENIARYGYFDPFQLEDDERKRPKRRNTINTQKPTLGGIL